MLVTVNLEFEWLNLIVEVKFVVHFAVGHLQVDHDVTLICLAFEGVRHFG